MNLDPSRWASQINWLEHTVPFGLLLVPVVAALGLKTLRERRQEASLAALYLLLLFGVWAAGVLGYTRISGTRFWIGIAPIYILVLLLSLDLLRNWFTDRAKYPLRLRTFLITALIGWAGLVILSVSLYYGPMGYLDVVGEGYGVPCSQEGAGCHRTVEDQYSALRKRVGKDDVVISSNPFVTSYYLRGIDGWLVQRRIGTDHTTFDSPTDEYFGVPLIDRSDKLLELNASPRRVWIIIPTGPVRDLSADYLALLQSIFRTYQEPGPLAVYVNSAE